VATPRPAPATTPDTDEAAQEPVHEPAVKQAAVSYAGEEPKQAVTASAPETVRPTTPGGDKPAPLQVHIGAGGISTSASGPPTEGGSAAYLPATVAGDTVAHRLPSATDVGVRRHDAEAPTVSPD